MFLLFSPTSESGGDDDLLSLSIKKANAFLKVRGFSDAEAVKDCGIHGIPSKIDALRSNRIWLKSGAFLIIEQLESFNAIDVNTGKYTGTKNVEQTIFKVNEEATIEIAKQLRLRDIGGIIIIDYILIFLLIQKKYL